MDPALDRFDIIDTTVRMAWHADRREWDALNEVFAPQVRLDYTSLTGRRTRYRRAGRPHAPSGWKTSSTA